MRNRMLLPIVLIAVIFAIQTVFIIVLWRPDGIRISYPARDVPSSVSLRITGSVWMAPGQEAVEGIELSARPSGGVPGEELRIKATRLIVSDRGKPLFPLHLWQATLELPEPGAWELSARAWAKDGRSVVSTPRSFVALDIPPQNFRPWSGIHLVTLVIALLVISGIGIASALGRERFMKRFSPVYTLLALGNEIAWHVYWFLSDSWSIQDNLMVHMCGAAILLVPVAMEMKPGKLRDRLSEILYFWGMGGAVQALIFPDIGAYGFPSYRFFAFFVSHTLIMAGSLSLATSGIARITIGSMVRMYVVTTLILVPMWFFDQAVALAPPYAPANYFLMGFSPPMGSIVDLFAQIFGPTPWYALGFEIMGVFVFGVLWLPWALVRRIAVKKNAARVSAV